MSANIFTLSILHVNSDNDIDTYRDSFIWILRPGGNLSLQTL